MTQTRSPLRPVALRLAVAQTLVWAGSFYLFPAMLPTWEADMGWSKAELSGAFTAALLLSAFGAPLAGRWIDRGHATRLFVGSFVLSAGTLFALSQVTELWQFYACWLMLGVTMAGTLYEACFALLTRCFGDAAPRAITIVTLVAGFAGSVSFPSADYLTELFDWRVAVIVFGMAILCVAAPLAWHASTVALRYSSHETRKRRDAAATATVAHTLRKPLFWLLCLAFVCIALDHGLLLTHLLPLLSHYGLSENAAVLAAACIGPMQVTGRVLMVWLQRRMDILVIAAFSFIAGAAAAVSLLGVAALPLLIVPFVVLHGSGYGVTSIVRPVVTARMLGRENFGAVSGFMALPFMAAFAAAPSIAALIWKLGGYDLVVYVAIAIMLSGLVFYIAALKLHSSIAASSPQSA